MIELHGWLSVVETYKDEDQLLQFELNLINEDIKEIVYAQDSGVELRYINGSAFINTIYCSNHYTQEVDDIIDIYKKITSIATGSYGMLYIRDDEDLNHYNDFQVYVFKRGTYFTRTDTDLSPCIPTIEDTVI